MATLIIRDVPEKTYKRLKENADRHRRSLSKEALVVLEERLHPYDVPKIDWSKFPVVRLKGAARLSADEIQKMIDEGQK